MKKYLTIVMIVLTSVTANAQYVYSANTFYLIPPTNGCNGVWAIKDSLNCPTFSIIPFSCAQFDHINGDTMFLQLCSIPCEFYSSSNGNQCLQATCAPDGTTGITEYYRSKELDIKWQDNYTFTLKNTQDEFDRISVISITGQTVIERTNLTGNENIIFNTHGLANGLYIIEAFKNGEIMNMKKIIKN